MLEYSNYGVIYKLCTQRRGGGSSGCIRCVYVGRGVFVNLMRIVRRVHIGVLPRAWGGGGGGRTRCVVRTEGQT